VEGVPEKAIFLSVTVITKIYPVFKVDIKCMLIRLSMTFILYCSLTYILNNHLLTRRVWRYQGVIRIRKSKNRQDNGQRKKYKMTNNDLQNIHIKLKIEYTRTPLRTGGELGCSGRVSSSCSTSGTRRVNIVTNPVISREWIKDREVFTTSGTYPCSFVTQIF